MSSNSVWPCNHFKNSQLFSRNNLASIFGIKKVNHAHCSLKHKVSFKTDMLKKNKTQWGGKMTASR